MGLGLGIFFEGKEGGFFQKLIPFIIGTEEYAIPPKSPNHRSNKLVIQNPSFETTPLVSDSEWQKTWA